MPALPLATAGGHRPQHSADRVPSHSRSSPSPLTLAFVPTVCTTQDAVGESIQNVGLAQAIQNGLSKGQQVEPQWASADAVSGKASQLRALGPEALSKLRFGAWVMSEYEAATGKSLSAVGAPGAARMSVATVPEVDGGAPTSSAAWDEFTETAAFQLMAKYMAYADKLKAEPVTHKQFHEARPLGKGAFGAVFLVFKKDTGMAMATKKMVKAIAKKNNMIKDVLIEREVLAKIRSRFCVNLHYSYQDDVTIYLVLTLAAGGDLQFLLKSRYPVKKGQFDPLPDGAVKFYAASMACGLQAIHDAGYVYRDLKPQNVLLDAEGQVRISDMGLTADISKGPIKQCSGTRGYWSPETIKKEPYTTQPDWWSLGVTMFVLFSDKMPFSGKGDEEKDAATCKGEINYKHEEPKDLQEVISALCTIDVSQRLGCQGGGVAELRNHPYFAGFDWQALEAGTLAAPIQPNVNDINAPSAKEIAAFVKPKDVEWTGEDQAKFAEWDSIDTEVWGDEAIARIKKRKELAKAIGAKAPGPGAANQASAELPTVAYAKLNRESKKGEDFAAAVLEGAGAPAGFAVFDGHSGKDTARICSEVVCQRLIKAGPPFTEKAITDMLWAVDEEIGTQKIRDGATAQILLVEKDGDGLKGTFAWCGDSSAVMTKMGPGGGTVAFATESHTAGPDHQEGGNWKEEGKTLRFYGEVRKKVEELNGIDTLKAEATPEMVEAAIKALGEDASADNVALLTRALRRGKIIAETNPQGAEWRKKVFVRQRDKDHDVNQVWVVSTAESRADPGYSDLQMTRSMCDWRASDMVLPHPQIHTFTVPAGESVRICLASDGLWDVCKFEDAAKMMHSAKSVKSACKNIMEIPEVEYLENRKHAMMDDDTTVLIIELNPGGIAPPAAGGCCEIM